MKPNKSKYINPVLRITAAIMLLFAFSFTACSGTLFKNLLRSLDRIEVSPGLVEIPNGTTTQLQATAIFSDGTKKDITAEATWLSSNPNLISVDSAGLASAIVKSSTVTITASYKDYQATATVNSTAALLVSLQVSPGTKKIAKGTSHNLYAIGVFTDNSTMDLSTLAVWSSSNNTACPVTSSGVITGQTEAAGITITATATIAGRTRYNTSTIDVSDAELTAITLSKTAIELIEGTQYQLRATAVYSDNTTQDVTSLSTWSVTSGGSYCSVASGVVTGVDVGSAVVQASYTLAPNTKTSTTSVTVTAATITGIIVTPEQTIAYGDTVQFKVMATLDFGDPIDVTKQVTWSTDPAGIAEVSNAAGKEGLATSLTAGDTEVTATLTIDSYEYTDTAALSVRMATLQSLTINYDTTDVNVSDTKEFHVLGTYWDGSTTITYDITDQVSWSSTAPSVADISNVAGTKGIATGISGGTTTITASKSGITDTATLNVLVDSIPPSVENVELLLDDWVRVTFSENMDIVKATAYGSYKIVTTVGGTCGAENTFTSPLSIQTGDFTWAFGTPIVVESLKSYVLKLSAGTQEKTYTLIVDDTTAGILDTAGNDIDCPDNQFSFPGRDTVKPYMLNVINSGKYITVRYSEPMKTGGGTAAADDPDNYTLTLNPSGDPGVTISGVTAIDNQNFLIELSGYVTPGTSYKLTVADTVTDRAAPIANVMTTPKYLTFIGDENLKVISAEEITMGTIIITFNKAVCSSANASLTSDCNLRYKIYPTTDIGALGTATVGTGNLANTVTLTYTPLNEETRLSRAYTIMVANGIDGDNFDNGTMTLNAYSSDTGLYPDGCNTTDSVQGEPNDRATFQGLGKTMDNFNDGSFFEDPFVDGTSFSFAFTYGDRVYLGTNDINNAAFRFDPNGANSVLITFSATQHPDDILAIPPEYCSLATGFGYGLGDVCGTNYGFHGERGVVGFNSVRALIGGNPYDLLVAGTLKDGVNYAYFTQDLDTELGWTPFKFGVTAGNNTKSIQTIYAANNYLYLGFSSSQNTQAPLLTYHAMTADGNGVVTVPYGDEIGASSIPDIGQQGGNPALNGDVVGIDSIIYHNNILYLANNGGIYGSTSQTSFAVAVRFKSTPSGFTDSTLQLPAAPGGLEKISPGQRGIPILMEFNGRLYMARNVALDADTGRRTALRGEVWRWDPATDDTTVNNRPDPDEWEKIISGTESQIDTASSISMLIANGNNTLYLGYDNPTNGLRIFKYSGTSPVATNGSTLGTQWVQQGVTGLGGSYQRILSATSIDYGTDYYIYVTVVNGTNAIRVLRQKN